MAKRTTKEEDEEIEEQQKSDKKEEVQEEEGNWYLGEVPTQTQSVVVNRDDPKEPLSTEQALVEILNKLDKLETLL